MTAPHLKIARAEADAAAAKARIGDTVAQLKDRLNPRYRALALWDDTRDRGMEVGDTALEFAYERPRLVAGIAAGGVLLLLRRPIIRLVRRLASSRQSKWDETISSSNSAGAVSPKPRKGGRR